MGTEYTPTDDDRPAEDASLAEDIIELQLLTAGEKPGPQTQRTPRNTTTSKPGTAKPLRP